jgi:hypothetical protein
MTEKCMVAWLEKQSLHIVALQSPTQTTRDGLFSVAEMHSSTPVDQVVDLNSKTCTCRRWQQSGILCPHVISCAKMDKLDPLTLVDKCYSIEMHKKAYANIVYPCKGKSEWEKMNCPTILPPTYKKHVGRPTKSRRNAPGEVDCRGGGKRVTRHGVIMHRINCGKPGHNIHGCYWFKNGLPVPDEAQLNMAPPPANTARNPDPNSTQDDQQQPPTYQDILVGRMAHDVS